MPETTDLGRTRHRHRRRHRHEQQHRARSDSGHTTAASAAVSVAVTVLALASIVVGGLAGGPKLMSGSGRPAGVTAVAATTSRPPSSMAASLPAAVGRPIKVTVARLNLSSSLQALGLAKDGSLQSPSKWEEAGWYADGVRPGEVGPAVIAGHVESSGGPAVFYRLPTIKVGDDVAIQDDLGATRHFVVNGIQQYPKQKFPSQAIYGPAAVPTVRLITCYGDFDQAQDSYVDNLVVTAVLKP